MIFVGWTPLIAVLKSHHFPQEASSPLGSSARNTHIINFADYSLDLETAELRRNGTKIVLQAQPFRILTTLIESSGRLVTREELIKKLWPTGTFVDYDQSLNRAVARLREALGDDAEQPRFVETLPRKGYRFVSAREPLKGNSGETYTDVIVSSLQQTTLAVSRGDSGPAANQPQSEAPAESVPIWAPSIREGDHGDHTTAPRDQPKRSAIWITTAVAGVMVVVLTFVMIRSGPRPEVPIHLSIEMPTEARDLALSPDGNSLAFVAPTSEGHADTLWVRPLHTSSAQVLPGSAGASYPFWSPDSQFVAFFR